VRRVGDRPGAIGEGSRIGAGAVVVVVAAVVNRVGFRKVIEGDNPATT